MSINAFGDLGQSLFLRRETSRLNSELQKLAGELASGQRSDLADYVSGDFRTLAGLERSIDKLDAYSKTIEEVSLITSVSQEALEKFGSGAIQIANSIVGLDAALDTTSVDALGTEARGQFSSAVSALNTSIAGRSLFSGRAFDTAPLVDAETILADLSTAASGATNATDVLTVLDTYFSPGGTFETVSYLGSPISDPILVDDGFSVSELPLATDPRISETLKNLAAVALIDTGVLAGNTEERANLARFSGIGIISAENDLLDIRSKLGSSQQRVEMTKAEIAAERSIIEIARQEITATDQVQTATELRHTEEQLQTIFIITGRLSSLNLSAYL